MTSNVNSMIFEVTAGVGGQEAMLFAAEMIAMYEGFIEFNGWQKDVTEVDKSDIGNYKINFCIQKESKKNMNFIFRWTASWEHWNLRNRCI